MIMSRGFSLEVIAPLSLEISKFEGEALPGKRGKMVTLVSRGMNLKFCRISVASLEGVRLVMAVSGIFRNFKLSSLRIRFYMLCYRWRIARRYNLGER
jgi:hypothetical protein